jgi:hypothetical protein
VIAMAVSGSSAAVGGSSSFPAQAVTESGAVAAADSGGSVRLRSVLLDTAAFVVYGEKCKSARLATVYYRLQTWRRQLARNGQLADRTPIVRGKSCRWARFTAAEWQARARSARRSLERWMRDRLLRDFAAHPGSHAWHRAVQEAQRAYPNTKGWLLSCSASEGGWGRWVPNSQGSGVGGWMQMYPSTFWRMFSAAKHDLHKRGFRVPRSAASWYSPLGQALASAWGLTNGRRHEWHGAGC